MLIKPESSSDRKRLFTKVISFANAEVVVKAFAKLQSDTLNTLNTCLMYVDEVEGTDTTASHFCICYNQETEMFGISPFKDRAMRLCGIGDLSMHKARVISRNILYTPMRINDLMHTVVTTNQNSPIVPNPTRKVTTMRYGNNYDMWLTCQQSGCSVLILDWGGTYSMIHLQPSFDAEFEGGKGTSKLLATNGYSKNLYKNLWLQVEATQTVWNSMLGTARPLRYILVQSMKTASVSHRTQIIGLPNHYGGWDFYRQKRKARVKNGKYDDGPAEVLHLCERLKWTNWTWYLEYMPYLSYD